MAEGVKHYWAMVVSGGVPRPIVPTETFFSGVLGFVPHVSLDDVNTLHDQVPKSRAKPGVLGAVAGLTVNPCELGPIDIKGVSPVDGVNYEALHVNSKYNYKYSYPLVTIYRFTSVGSGRPLQKTLEFAMPLVTITETECKVNPDDVDFKGKITWKGIAVLLRWDYSGFPMIPYPMVYCTEQPKYVRDYEWMKKEQEAKMEAKEAELKSAKDLVEYIEKEAGDKLRAAEKDAEIKMLEYERKHEAEKLKIKGQLDAKAEILREAVEKANKYAEEEINRQKAKYEWEGREERAKLDKKLAEEKAKIDGLQRKAELLVELLDKTRKNAIDEAEKLREKINHKNEEYEKLERDMRRFEIVADAIKGRKKALEKQLKDRDLEIKKAQDKNDDLIAKLEDDKKRLESEKDKTRESKQKYLEAKEKLEAAEHAKKRLEAEHKEVKARLEYTDKKAKEAQGKVEADLKKIKDDNAARLAVLEDQRVKIETQFSERLKKEAKEAEDEKKKLLTRIHFLEKRLFDKDKDFESKKANLNERLQEQKEKLERWLKQEEEKEKKALAVK